MAARLYAELLTNIRKVSATIELPTPSNDTTFLAVKSGGFTLHHDGTEQQLKLPGVVDPSYVATKPATGLQQLSCRMPLAPRQTAQPRSLSEGTPVAPWNATDLTSSSRFTCRSCDAVILAENTVTTWQDLPSAHWAEMMDFWHCHKPAVPKTNGNDDGKEDKLQEKGYGASTSFSAQKGVGKVDLMSFLLAEDDIGSAVVRTALYFLSFTLSHLPLLCFSRLMFAATTGIKKEALPAHSCHQWLCHRYKYPKTNQSTPLSYGLDPTDSSCRPSHLRMGHLSFWTSLFRQVFPKMRNGDGIARGTLLAVFICQ